jgi:pimeloyl-[acyl-carrier protein] methyl ester esterase
MDGTGKLFEPFQRHLPAQLRTRSVSYPTDRALGYDELLRTIEVPRASFAVVAESFSGPLGIRMAANHGSQVRALVLVATFVRPPFRLAPSLRAFARPSVFALRPPDLALRWALLGMDADRDELDTLRSTMEGVDPAVLARRLAEILTVNVSAELERIRAPILCLVGRRDRLVGARATRQLRELRPDLEVAVIDAPHLVLQRMPAEAARVVIDFFHRHELLV